MTLDKVLTSAETLPRDEREMLEELLRKRRIDAWRQETAAEAKRALRTFRAGKLKAESVETAIGHLRAGLQTESE
jgi:hypothetical protein